MKATASRKVRKATRAAASTVTSHKDTENASCGGDRQSGESVADCYPTVRVTLSDAVAPYLLYRMNFLWLLEENLQSRLGGNNAIR